MTQTELRRLAQVGAQIRLGQLRLEIESIYTTFPELRRGTSSTAPSPASDKRRKKMSAGARRKIALAQRKRWAEWRKKKGKNAAG
jgi:hypothetical protein